MGHPNIQNHTPFAFEPIFLADEDGQPLFTPLIKATYVYQDGMELNLSEEQVPVNFSGELHGDPETSSYKYEPECSFIKPATDIVLIGHAHAPNSKTTELDVGLRVGPVQKIVHVIGDRYLTNYKGAVSISTPMPFEKIPLTYERAYGGWDRRNADPAKHSFNPYNPVGTGFGFQEPEMNSPVRLPNLDDPKPPFKGLGRKIPAAGFGFISPNWQPRLSFAGTYDKKWDESRKPLLPMDFDRKFFNAASPGLIAPGYLRGDEAVTITNATPNGRISFNLPGITPPTCTVELRDRKKMILQTQLDTVIINTDENLVFLLWRAHMVVKNGPHDILAIEIDTESKTESSAVG